MPFPDQSTPATVHDISVTLRPGIPEWPGDTPFTCNWAWRIAAGASVNVSSMTGSPHVGTHADAPLHVADGALGAADLPVDAFVGPATVVDVTAHDPARALELSDLPPPAAIAGGRLLLRTGRTIAGGAFPEAWPALSPACAQSLAAAGLRLLGVDAPSVDARESKSLDVHHVVFAAGACVLENLDLRGISPGDYELIAAPIKIADADAAPVRAVLRPLAREKSQ